MERPATTKARQPLDPDATERWEPPDLANCETDLLDEEETEYRVDEEDNEEDIETDEQVVDVHQLPESTTPRFEVIRQQCMEPCQEPVAPSSPVGWQTDYGTQKDVGAEREFLASLLDHCTRKLEHELREHVRKHKFLLEDTLFRELDQFGTQVHRPVSKISRVSCDSPRLRVTNSETSEDKHLFKSHRRSRNHKEVKSHLAHGDSAPDVKELCRNKMKQEAQATNALKADASVFYKKTYNLLTRPRLSRAMSVLAPQNLIHGTFFNLLSAALIVGNAAFIGFQTHVGITNEFSSSSLAEEEDDVKNGFVEICFLAFFTAELILRLIYDRLDFLRGVEWRWNLFDSMIVGLSIIETVAASILTGVGMSFPFLRLIRVVRVLRVLKVLHMIPFFKRLGLMMSSVAASLSALLPAIVLLMLVIYTFGICVMQGIINFLADGKTHPEDFLATLNVRFGSLRSTMATLFMAITGGLSWVEVMSGLLSIGEAYYLIFMFYVGFVQICVLNIVTGVFVDTVQQMYQPEREEIVERETAKKKAMLANLKGLLSEADEDESGTITWQEFQHFTNDKDIKMYLAAHEIDITQAREIFSLIDAQGTGEVSIDEFVLSFIEFKGTAKGSDVMILRNDIQKMLSRVMPFISESSKTLDELRLMVQDVLDVSTSYSESDPVLGFLASSPCKGPGRGIGRNGSAVDWKQLQESPRPLES